MPFFRVRSMQLPPAAGSPAAAAAKPPPPQDAVSVRRAIVAGFAKGAATSSSAVAKAGVDLSFDSLVADYAVPAAPKKAPAPEEKKVAKKVAAVVEKGEFEGIW